MTTLAGGAEQRLLRRTRIVVTVQLATAITTVVLLVGGLAYAVTVRQQEQTAQLMLRHALDYGHAGMQDPCSWLFTLRGRSFDGAAGAPVILPVRTSMLRVADDGRPIDEYAYAGGDRYRVRTERHGDEVRQAVFNEQYAEAARRQLLAALAFAGLAGLAVAAATGSILVRRAIAPVEEVLERQRRFVADASHELRAPLTRLRTRAQLLQRRESGASSSLALELTRLVEGTRELGEVLDDLLRSARLRAGAPEYEQVDLPALAVALVAAEGARLAERKLVAEVRSAPDIVVAGSESSLRRMLSALVDNAIGHTPPGGWMTVSMRVLSEARIVEIVVADNGVGIDPIHRIAIFERSVYLTGGDGDRNGIGLALAKEIVESHGGTIHADSEARVGARLVVRLPVSPA